VSEFAVPTEIDPSPYGVVVVGGGPAAASLAKALRDRGYDRPITIVSNERFLPYERPPLSKTYLKGQRDRDSLGVLPEGWYAANRVDVRSGETVLAIEPGVREVITSGGQSIPFASCVIATGGRPRPLSVPGLPVSRTYYLRSLADADRLRNELKPGRRLTIVGAGFIGGELAATARALGVEVTMIEALKLPLLRVLGLEIADLYRSIHLENGVHLITESSILGAVGSSGEGFRLDLSSGRALECDLVAIGVGMIPNREVAEHGGVECRAGVLVDEFGATNIPGVFAAGDVAEHFHPLFGEWMRTEHHEHALRHPLTVAEAILGRRQPYIDPHWFWSEQYEYRLEVTGAPHLADAEVQRGSVVGRSFTRFFLRQGRLVGAIGLNSGHDVRRAWRLIASRAGVDARALHDPDVDLRALALAAESQKVGPRST
jgi:3-phenylpropionate/trans-cinnamate dioxygenase ferredoxin reductase subunit